MLLYFPISACLAEVMGVLDFIPLGSLDKWKCLGETHNGTRTTICARPLFFFLFCEAIVDEPVCFDQVQSTQTHLFH